MTNLLKTGLSFDVISNIQGVFSSFSLIKEVILYGSRAMGNYRTGSDIDLTIELTNDSAASITLLSQVSMAIDDLDLVYSFDLSFLCQIENDALLEHIKTKGLLFYVRA